MISGKKPILPQLLALFLIIATGCLIQWKHMNEYPTFIHAWAEQDHYALALGFIDNGFDFFHPQTNIYNKQFPGWWQEAYNTTMTSSDFPAHEYFAALLMKLFGTTAPWVFRSWTLLWALLGVFFLFKICFKLTNDWPKSMLAASIAMTAPVAAYYQNGFLPGVPALSMNIIGLWLYLKYYDGQGNKHFHLSIAFLTVAMLLRTTFAIGLIAVLCFEVLRIFRKESTWSEKLPTVALSFTAFLTSYLWNQHLRELDGTIFLDHLLPPENWQDAKELIAEAYHRWGLQYFQQFQYWLFLAILVAAITVGIIHLTKKEEKKDTPAKHPLSLWWLPCIQFFGCLLFTIVMMRQIQYHDYYFIDTFFLPLLIVVILLLSTIPKPQNKHLMATEYILVAVLLAVMINHVTQTQISRRDPSSIALASYHHYKDSDQLLDSLNIPRDAKVLCLYGYAQNGPFIQMKRKGFSIMEDKDEMLEAAFTFDFDCVVIENEKLGLLEKRPEKLASLKKIGGNEKISVFLPL